MPMVAAGIASAVTWVSSAAAAAVTATATGLAAVGAVSAFGMGGTYALAAGILKVAAVAAGSYAMNAVLAPKLGSAGSPVQFKADPSSPIRGVMGHFGTGGTQAHFRVWGKDNLMISYMVILSLGPIQGISQFTANNIAVDFPGPNGASAPVEPYKDKMWMTYKMGLPTDGSLAPPPVGGNPAMEWYSYHRTSGYAGAFWTMQNNSKRASYEGGPPKPLWEVLGQKLYDPRKDSTQTSIGGSGSHRIDDWRTWEYTQNPLIHAYNWCLGHHKKLEGGVIDRTKLLAGVGANPTYIDLPTFVAGANVSDANGWTISGEWNTQDGKWQVLAGMLQAGSSVPVHVGAKIGVMTNTPKVPVATINGSDILGNTNIKVMASSRDRFNTVYPRYINENQNWEYGTAGAVSSQVYVDQDGGNERSKEITYNYVSDPKQAGQLAAYDLANTRETLKMAFISKPHHLGIKPGDAVLVNSPERGLVNQKFVVVARPIDIMDGTISFDLRSETDSKHSWALGQSAQPAPSPALSPINPAPSEPDEGSWTIIPRPADPGGTQQPGFIIEGEVPDGIGSVLFEFGPENVGPWKQFYQGPPTTERIELNGLQPGSTYYVRVTYFSIDGYPSEPRVFGPYVSPGLVADTIVKFPDGSNPIWNYPTVDDLPQPPEDGQNFAWVEDEEKLYEYRDGQWTKAIDGGDIEPGTLNNLSFAAGLQAPGLGPTLPNLPDEDWPEGSMFVNTTDGKTYTNRGGTWSASIDASDIVGTVPTGIPYGPINPATGSPDQLFHNTTDEKLYRWNGTAWTAAADGQDLIAGSITTNKIAVGAIQAAQIGAGAVTASKLFVGDLSNLVPDPQMIEAANWTAFAGWTFVPSGAPAGFRSVGYAQSDADAGTQGSFRSGFFSVEEGSHYFASVQVDGTPNGAANVRVSFRDANNVETQITIAPIQTGESASQFIVPAGMKTAQILVTYNGSNAIKIGGFLARRAMSGELVVDGAITTDKLAANSVVAGKISAGAVTASAIASEAITSSKIYVGDLSNLIDGKFFDTAGWTYGGSGTSSFENGVSADDLQRTVFYNTSAAAGSAYRYLADIFSPKFAVEGGKEYSFGGKVRAFPTAVGRNQLYAKWFDLSGAEITVNIVQTFDAPGNSATANISGTLTAPADAVTGQLRIRVAGGPDGSYTPQIRWRDLYVRKAMSAELVVDGAITTVKLAANAVTADKIIAGAVTANKINVTNLAAISANLGAITAGSINIGNLFTVSTAGAVTIKSSSATSRTEVIGGTTKVFNNGVLRVQLGDQSI